MASGASPQPRRSWLTLVAAGLVTTVGGRWLHGDPPRSAAALSNGSGAQRIPEGLYGAGASSMSQRSYVARTLLGMLVERVHLKYPTIVEMVDEMEATGEMRPVHDYAFNGYADTPDELRDEVQMSGLDLESCVALEGISFAPSDLDQRLDDPNERQLLLDTCEPTSP